MNLMNTPGTNRLITFARALTLARYNLPLYIFAAFAIVLGLIVAVFSGLPISMRITGAVVMIVAFWYALASFIAFSHDSCFNFFSISVP